MDGESGSAAPPRGRIYLNVGGDWARFPDHQIFAGTVWHYTDAVGALSMLSAGEVWASSSLMMNDAGELDYAIERIRAAFDGWTAVGHPGAHSSVQVGIRTLEADLYANPPFIVSGSKSDRLLNQWANYGATSGYAIGFNPAVLLVPKSVTSQAPNVGPSDWRMFAHGWREVIYDPPAQTAHIRSILDEMVKPDGVLARTIEQDTARSDVVTKANLALLATTLKDPAFAAEQEVRYTFQLAAGMNPEYRATARGIVPYLPLVEMPPEDESHQDRASLPITTVTVGPPTSSEKRRTSSLISLRDSKRYSFSVQSAGIPYLP